MGFYSSFRFFFFFVKVRQSGTTVEAVQKECVELLGLTLGTKQIQFNLAFQK